MAEPGAVVHVVGSEPGADHPHERVILLVAALGGGERGERAGALRIADAKELLGGEAHRLIPGGLAERLVPLRRGGAPVPHVAVFHQPLPGLGRLAHLSGGRPGLPRLALLRDGGPGARAVAGLLAGPDPAAVQSHPHPADERLHQAIAVLGEVVAEAALDAGGALVGGPLLDPRRGHPHHLVATGMDVDLASDAAVRTDRAHHAIGMPDLARLELPARHHLEDRAGGADPDALAAPGAAGVIGVAVAPDDNLGVRAPLGHVEHTHLLDALAGADAPGAENAERHVVADHHVAGTGVAGAQRELVADRRRDVVARDVALELVPRIGPSAVVQVLARIALEQEAEHALPVLHRRGRFGLHHHALRRGGAAGGHELRHSLDRDEADATVGDVGELRVPAEGGDIDFPGPGRVENRGAGLEGDLRVIQGEARH